MTGLPLALLLGVILSAQSEAAVQPVCARVATTLRKGPGAKHPPTWKVAKFMPFLVLDSRGGWSKVRDMEEEVHWVRAVDVTNKFRCVAVKTNTASLHREPDKNSSAENLKSLDRYTPLKRIGDQADWVQVEDEAGHKAWVHTSQVWKPVLVNSFSF